VDGGAEEGEDSGDDQRDVHAEPSAIRAILWRQSGGAPVFGSLIVDFHPYSDVWMER
jgi:hypothetical protein